MLDQLIPDFNLINAMAAPSVTAATATAGRPGAPPRPPSFSAPVRSAAAVSLVQNAEAVIKLKKVIRSAMRFEPTQAGSNSFVGMLQFVDSYCGLVRRESYQGCEALWKFAPFVVRTNRVLESSGMMTAMSGGLGSASGRSVRSTARGGVVFVSLPTPTRTYLDDAAAVCAAWKRELGALRTTVLGRTPPSAQRQAVAADVLAFRRAFSASALPSDLDVHAMLELHPVDDQHIDELAAAAAADWDPMLLTAADVERILNSA